MTLTDEPIYYVYENGRLCITNRLMSLMIYIYHIVYLIIIRYIIMYCVYRHFTIRLLYSESRKTVKNNLRNKSVALRECLLKIILNYVTAAKLVIAPN